MTTHRLNDNSFKGVIIICLFIILSLKSMISNAQSSRDAQDKAIYQKVKVLDDSIRKLNPRKFPVYIGGELSLSVPQYSLKSNISALAGMPVNFLGTNVAGVIGNPAGKIKASVGMYYSGSSVPYEIGMTQGSISASAYLLRLKEVSYHTFEPYVNMGLSYQATKFFGSYLPVAENGTSTQSTNYSSTDSPLLGKAGFTIMNVAAGVEYQLESNNNLFIHLFAEASYGMMINAHSSNTAFNGTTIVNPSAITVGINCGILK